MFNNGTTYKFRSNSVKNVGIQSNFHGVLISRPQIPIITLPQIFPLKIKKIQIQPTPSIGRRRHHVGRINHVDQVKRHVTESIHCGVDHVLVPNGRPSVTWMKQMTIGPVVYMAGASCYQRQHICVHWPVDRCTGRVRQQLRYSLVVTSLISSFLTNLIGIQLVNCIKVKSINFEFF